MPIGVRTVAQSPVDVVLKVRGDLAAEAVTLLGHTLALQCRWHVSPGPDSTSPHIHRVLRGSIRWVRARLASRGLIEY